MSRLLFLLAVVIVVYLLLKSYRRQAPKQDEPSSPSESSEEMVRCVKCGVHLPKSESILAGGNFFCSDAHRREYNSK